MNYIKIVPKGCCNIAALFVCVLLISCGGGGNESQAPTIEYAKTVSVADGTMADYMNADWLFQNYLGDNGIPEEVKPQFMPAMQMLANGFVLQLKTGQDVQANIEQVHSMFLQYAASGQAAAFFAQVQNDVASGTVAPTTKNDGIPQNSNFVEPVISNEDKLAIEDAKQRDLQEQLEIKNTAEKYGLPYKIDQHQEQWFIYSPTMKAGKGGSAPTLPKNHVDVYTWGWRVGDVVWVNGAGSITGVPGHNAIAYGGYGSGVFLIDANTDAGVRMHFDVQAWVDKYTEVRALTPRLNWSMDEYNCYFYYGGAYGCAPDSYQRMEAWWYTQDRIGYTYNWNFNNPKDTSKFYCSSLIWNAYNFVGYNILGSYVLQNYEIITPSNLKTSSNLVTFKVSKIQ